MLHGWKARVVNKEGAHITLQIDSLELYKGDDREQVTRYYMNVEEAELLASELLEAVKKRKEGD